ncbi:hypothetical protein DFQ28_010443 [Apophysomyces sp. BC1034]|nr:hypothetical protein DFQ30_000804 [Apophysomyces sp. BC1015]KAG0171229.1 hypothetical protein DFQ29_008956 [Apophysomyces sp. BC1021]KAG0184801.1 hypothetical protein DFQ28_010443 [Apophysomyces sp. BC1034]
MSTIHRRKQPLKTDDEQSSSDTPEKVESKKTGSNVLAIIATGLMWLVIFFFMGSYLITESWSWGYRGKWTNVNTYIPRKEIVLSEEQLSMYDGSRPDLPLYVALDGDVFDVSAGRGWYGPGGSYHHFAGKDAARAYVTGCFKEHITHDLRGFSEADLQGVAHWKNFYNNHHTYFKVGRVMHPPIDENTPIPKPCKQPAAKKP